MRTLILALILTALACPAFAQGPAPPPSVEPLAVAERSLDLEWVRNFIILAGAFGGAWVATGRAHTLAVRRSAAKDAETLRASAKAIYAEVDQNLNVLRLISESNDVKDDVGVTSFIVFKALAQELGRLPPDAAADAVIFYSEIQHGNWRNPSPRTDTRQRARIKMTLAVGEGLLRELDDLAK